MTQEWVHNPFLNFKVHAIVKKITGVNAPIHYNASHNYANRTRNSSRLMHNNSVYLRKSDSIIPEMNFISFRWVIDKT